MLRRRGSTGTVIAVIIACVVALFSFFSISSKNEELESTRRDLNAAYQENQALWAENKRIKDSHTETIVNGIANTANSLFGPMLNDMFNSWFK